MRPTDWTETAEEDKLAQSHLTGRRNNNCGRHERTQKKVGHEIPGIT